MSSGKPQRTVLYDAHVKCGARMVDFHGWEMPIQYAGIVEEHGAVRAKAGLFDLSHMGRVRVQGPGRRAFLQKVLTIDLAKVKPGRCRYTFLLNEQGGIIDDLLVYAGEKDDLLVVNASNREADLAWMRKHLPADVTLKDETFDVALIAIQGPESLAAVRKVYGLDPGALKYYTWADLGPWMLSRTGYTGEDGFEIFLPAKEAGAAWAKAISTGIAPVGLGARDTLRTEAGMPLHGNDISDTTTPLEAGLGFAVDLDKSPGFIGQEALKAAAPSRRLTGMVLDSKRSPRPGYPVLLGGKPAGTVSSGTYSPTLGKSIAMAYLPRDAAAPGTAVEVDVRGKPEKGLVVALPFYRRQKS